MRPGLSRYATRVQFAILAGLATALVLIASSCASLFRESHPRVEIIGPENITVTNTHGELLRVYNDGAETYALPQAGRDDSIIVAYSGRSHTIALAKHAHWLTALDILSDGPGFVIDDLSGMWCNYNAVYVHPDTSHSDFTVASTNWLGESAGRKRPELLLMGGLGLSLNVRPPMQDVAALLGPQISTSFKFQGGIGIDLYKKYELFYLGQEEPAYDLDPTAPLFLGQEADIASQSVAGRYFVRKNLFVQGSFGWARASTDTLRRDAEGREVKDADGFSVFDQVYSNVFPVIGVGIGWAGDISYVSLQYAVDTKPFALYRYRDVKFQSVFLDIGLNLRL